ncbi:MAG: glycine cleavage T C-terminal barrel domain-containing protein [Sumerlaeia bacterium]
MSKKTALNERFIAEKATFIKLGDWEVPDYFSSPDNEFRALMETAGLVDLSHDGRIKISGLDKDLGMDLMTTIKMDKLKENMARDAFLLNDRGRVLDFINILRSEKFYLLQTSCLAFEPLMGWLKEKASQLENFEITDSTTTQSALEVRGPSARTIMKAAIMDGTIPNNANEISISQIGQARCLIICYKENDVERFRINTGTYFLEAVYDRLMNVGRPMGIEQVGWRAQEMVRIQNFIPGIGAEYDENTSPLEIGMASAIDFNKESFVGKRALLHQTLTEFKRRLVRLEFRAPNTPMPGDTIELEGVPIGYITSAVRSPIKNVAIGMGFVDAIQSHPGNVMQVRLKQGMNTATIVPELELLPGTVY